jgi:glucosamine 6-phosphate synthetase-like amidotransferase/phosphosugar isomerase protein
VKYIYHAENGIEKVHNKITDNTGRAVAEGLINNYKEMHDEFSEFAQSFTLAYQATDTMQIAWFLENTIDNGQRLNANTTDLKVETAIRLNVKF